MRFRTLHAQPGFSGPLSAPVVLGFPDDDHLLITLSCFPVQLLDEAVQVAAGIGATLVTGMAIPKNACALEESRGPTGSWWQADL